MVFIYLWKLISCIYYNAVNILSIDEMNEIVNIICSDCSAPKLYNKLITDCNFKYDAVVAVEDTIN